MIKSKKKAENSEFIDLYGIHAVKAALKNVSRNHQKLTISRTNLNLITQEIKEKVPEINIISNKEFIKFYGNENVHQGIILKTSIIKQPTIEKIILETQNVKKEIIVMLDQVSDPNNIGSIIRSCSLFNCRSIIVSKDNSPNITASMAKAASGALELINYIKVTNLSRTINLFKKNNFWVCGLDNNINFENKFEIPKKCLLVVGAEGKGLRKLTHNECDEIVSIPVKKNEKYFLESLNVSNACSIALYEHFRK